MADWDKIKKDYENGLSYKELSTKYDVKTPTIRVHRSRGKWKQKDLSNVTDETTNETESVTLRNAVTQKKVTEDITNNDSLNDKQKRFCLLYLQYLNPTKAYYEVYDCTYESAKYNSSRLLANDKIKKLIQKCKANLDMSMVINKNDIVNRMIKSTGSSVTDFVTVDVQKVIDPETLNEDGKPHHYYTVQLVPKNLEELDTSVIESMSNGRDGFKISLPNKTAIYKELLKVLPEGKTNAKDDPVIKAVRQAAETGEGKIDADDIEE